MDERRRVVITAMVQEDLTAAEAARRYGLSRSTASRWYCRWVREGEPAFTPRSRRPHNSPGAIDPATVEAISELRRDLTAKGHDAGPQTLHTLLLTQGIDVSVSTIWRTLSRQGLTIPTPKKRPRSSYTRFAADLPNQTWQSDITHVRTRGATVEVLTFLDDYSRYALAITAHRRISVVTITEQFAAARRRHGTPASTLTDNGMVYTARFRGGRNLFERELARLGIEQKNGRGNHPQTQGKVERFQQTLKKHLATRPRARNIEELQTQLDTFRDHYNNHRPHSALGRQTPATAYTSLAKATPGGDPRSQHRIREDRIDSSGKVTLRIDSHMFKIGVGRTHARTRVRMLVQDYEVTIIAITTGEILRRLTIDPTRTYQPQ